MHFGLLAVRADIHSLREAFPQIWPNLEVVDSADGFETRDAFWAWMRDSEQFVSAAEWTREQPGTETYALFQDGPWSLLFDESYTLASDEAALQVLSQRFGTALSFVVETAGGCAYFWCYENGSLRRSILTSDGTTQLVGDRLPQEEGVDVDHYYMDEAEALMAAFGLAPVDEQPRDAQAIALAVVDRTDYSSLLSQKTPAPSPGDNPRLHRTSKPWWKFW